MFQAATGWLGWSADQALTTPISQIELAIDGKIDWTRMTNPWGSGDEEEKEAPSQDEVANKLRSFVKSRE